MTKAEELARFIVSARYSALSVEAVRHLKIRVMDSMGCVIGVLNGEPVSIIREQIKDFDSSGTCTMIGSGSSSPDRAALYRGFAP